MCLGELSSPSISHWHLVKFQGRSHLADALSLSMVTDCSFLLLHHEDATSLYFSPILETRVIPIPEKLPEHLSLTTIPCRLTTGCSYLLALLTQWFLYRSVCPLAQSQEPKILGRISI